MRRRFAQNQYDKYIFSGMSDAQAMSQVCSDLGHGAKYETKGDGSTKFAREDITGVYVKNRIINNKGDDIND